jgi:hypothetical protein
MTLRSTLFLGLLMVLGLGVGSLALWLGSGAEPSPTYADPAYRAARAAGANVSAKDWPMVVEREQRVLERMSLTDDHALREWVGSRFETIEPTDEELEEAWNEQREVFGHRSFEQSRDTLVRLVKLRRIRAELEAVAD